MEEIEREKDRERERKRASLREIAEVVLALLCLFVQLKAAKRPLIQMHHCRRRVSGLTVKYVFSIYLRSASATSPKNALSHQNNHTPPHTHTHTHTHTHPIFSSCIVSI